MSSFGELDASAIGTSCRLRCFINRLAPGSALILHHLHRDQITGQLKNLWHVLQCIQSKLLITSLYTKQLPEIAIGVLLRKQMNYTSFNRRISSPHLIHEYKECTIRHDLIEYHWIKILGSQPYIEWTSVMSPFDEIICASS